MAEVEFERRLERLFSNAPELPDSSAFAERIERRLDRGWTARRWLIGAAGVAGGVIGASQLMMSNLVQRVETAEDSARLLTTGLGQVTPQADWMAPAGQRRQHGLDRVRPGGAGHGLRAHPGDRGDLSVVAPPGRRPPPRGAGYRRPQG
ncbi:hypothetical protein [Phenylobacterium sp. J367]|uniref:hypothetical protein n=1 Tax=Phenylobacterium sp. J367 TaxID=2898435 RepID=UPI0021512698|nr:hypothetical protein [Phenylobacterium sp. J367]MCR5880278.1 hypothetical protein [Phenylobacterium sp. J367]